MTYIKKNKIFMCEECHEEVSLIHKHHSDRDRLNNDPSNIILLCNICHGREHGAEGIDERTIKLGDAYDMMTNKSRLNTRMREGFALLGNLSDD